MTNYPDSFYSSVSKRAAVSSKIVAQVLQDAITPQSVIDIGSGEGIWLNTVRRYFPTASKLTAIDLQSHDSEYFADLRNQEIDFSFVKRNFEIDPTLPDTQYDLAICLEVLEHLKKETAESLVSEIAKKASILVFSAAMKGQGGTGHINENSFEYWMELLEKNNFIPIDVLRPKMAKEKFVPDYYKQNMILFWHPGNCSQNKTVFSLETLLTKNPLPVSDIRGVGKKIRYFLGSFIPPRAVTFIVVILDKTVRR